MKDIISITNGRVFSVWYCPPNEGREELLLVETPGDKRYRRMWFDHPPVTGEPAVDDWTWHRPDDAILLAGDSDE